MEIQTVISVFSTTLSYAPGKLRSVRKQVVFRSLAVCDDYGLPFLILRRFEGL